MSEDVLFEVRGHLGVITLDRPEAMNALTLPMVEQMHRQLMLWRDDDAVAQVLIRGSGDRGLCAGGDIRAIHEDIRATHQRGDDDYATAAFFAAEYRLNVLIHQFPKPYIAFMDGITLGGGVGVSAHGSHRVVTERTKTGMPETTIGYSPDVGGTYLLSRSPGQTGVHAGLTGGIFGAADAIHLGLADAFVPSAQLDALATALESRPVAELLPEFAEPAPEAPLAGEREWIDHSYATEDAEELLERLESWAATHPSAGRTRETILAKSPTAVKLTLHGIQQARHLDLATAFLREYAAARHQLRGHDFVEGIRAQVIDKDKAPQWQPGTLAEVSPAAVEAAFTPDPHHTLDLSPAPQEARP